VPLSASIWRRDRLIVGPPQLSSVESGATD
jgi:hypothetical protein